MEINKNLALALFGVFLVCAAAFILLLPPSDGGTSVPIRPGGAGIEYELHPSSGIEQSVYGVGENGSLLEMGLEEPSLPEGSEPPESPSQPSGVPGEASFEGEGQEEPPEEDVCKMLGLSGENCNDDLETVFLKDLEEGQFSLNLISFVPDIAYPEKSSGGSSVRRKLVVSNVSETELTDLTFKGEGGEVVFKKVSLSEIPGEAELSSAFILKHNLIGVDSRKYPELDIPAKIKFTDVYGLKDAYPMRNGEPCGSECSNFKYDHKTGRASMDVSGFSNYSIGGINITYAEHLDSSYGFISDITSQVKDKDGVWSEQIPVGNFVRSIFEENLTDGKVIDVYARKGGASNVYFNIYPEGATSPLIGTSGPLSDSGGWVYITVQGLPGEEDTFDFKIMGDSGGYAEFDYIHDVDVGGCTNISYPGTYVLTQNLTGAPYSVSLDTLPSINQTCILIESSDVVLDCNGYSILNNGTGDATGIAINGTNVTRFENIEIRNCPGIGGYRNGITVNGGENVTIRNTSISNITVDSIIALSSRYCLFTNISIYDAGGGIGFAESSLYNNATNANIRETDICIGSSLLSNYTIFDSITCNNTADEGTLGLWALVSSNVTISNSLFSGFDAGIFVDRSEDVFAYNNTIRNGVSAIVTQTAPSFAIQAHLLGDNNTVSNFTKALEFVADTYYIEVNLTNTTILPYSGTYENYSVIDVHDIVGPSDQYSIKWASGPASFGGYPDPYISYNFNNKFLNITSNSSQTIHVLTWHWTSGETSGYAESSIRMVQNASSSGRTIFSETPDTGNHTLTIDSLQLNPQTDNFGLFDERLDCLEPADDLYINRSIYLCEGWYDIPDAGDTGVIIFNNNSIDVICMNNNVTINGTGTGVGFYFPGSATRGTNSRLINCTIDHYAEGIRARPAGASLYDNSLINNTIRNSPTGILIHAQNYAPNGYQYRWLIANNTIVNSTTYGLYLYCYDISGYQYYHNITNNTFRDTPYGVSMNRKNYYHNLTYNNFYNISGYGVRMDLTAGNPTAGDITGYASTWQNEVGPSNKIDGYPMYHYFNHSNEVFEGLELNASNQGTSTGLFTCVGCTNITFKNNEFVSSPRTGALFVAGSNITAENNNISNANLDGWGYAWPWEHMWKCGAITMYDSVDSAIRFNDLTNSTFGVFSYGANTSIYNNSAYNSSIGIELKTNDGTAVSNNTVTMASDAGIRLNGEDYSLVTENLIQDSASGIHLFQTATHNTVIDNEIYNMSVSGLRLRTTGVGVGGTPQYNTLENNTIINAVQGIHLYNSEFNNFTTNDINDTTDGIYFAVYGTQISPNNFVGNRIYNATNYGVYLEPSSTSWSTGYLFALRNYFYCDNYYEGERFCIFYDVHNATFEDYYGSPGYDGDFNNDATDFGMITIIDSTNFTFTDMNISHDREYGFLSLYSDNITLENSSFSDNGDAGNEANVRLFGSSDNRVQNVSTYNGRNGIVVGFECDYSKIFNNTVTNASLYGIWIRESAVYSYEQPYNTHVENNTLLDNPTHIAFRGSISNSTVRNNEMSGGEYGVYYNRENDGETYRYHILENNKVENVSNTCYYIRAQASGYYEYLNFSNNNCTNATYGMYLWMEGVNSRFRHNIFDAFFVQNVNYGLYGYLNYYSTSGMPIENNTYSNFDINATVFPILFRVNTGSTGYPMKHTLINFTLRNDVASDFYETEDPTITHINITNITFHRNLGSIYFNYLNFNASNSIKASNTILDSDIASIDSTVHTYFQVPANVTISSASCPANIYWKDGFPTTVFEILTTGSSCPGDRCYYEACADNIVNFTVSNFSGYTANEVQEPRVENVTLFSSAGTNYTTENLTVTYDAFDPDAEDIKNITTWLLTNGSVTNKSIMTMFVPFEGGGDSARMKDFTPYGHNVTSINSMTYYPDGGHDGWGVYGCTASTSVYAQLNNSAMDGLQDFTIMMWVNRSYATSTDDRAIISAAGASSSNEFFMYVVNSNTMRIAIRGGEDDFTGFTLNQNDWTHMAFKRTGDQGEFFVDGVSMGTATVSNAQLVVGCPASTGFILCQEQDSCGGTFSAAQAWVGMVDDIQVFNMGLEDEQIAAIANKNTDMIHFRQTRQNETWQACVTPTDRSVAGNTNCSNTLYVPPLGAENVSMNSTLGTNYTTENITLNYDLVNGSEMGIINWYVDSNSIMLLNMPFEGYSGAYPTVAKDYSPYGNNANLVSGATWVPNGGRDGFGAYNFTAATQFVRIPYTTVLEPADAITVETWVNPAVTPSAVTKIVSKTEVGGYALWFDASASAIFEVRIGGTYYQATSSPGLISADNWYHLVGTYDGQNLDIYVNGELNGSTPLTGTMYYSTDAPVCLGAETTSTTCSGNQFTGLMEGARIYNRALSAEQVLALYNNRTDMIVSNETDYGENWTGCVLPNGDWEDSLNGETCENITIREPPLTCQVISSGGPYSLPEAASGAPLSIYGPPETTKACVIIDSDNVEFSCNGYTITNDGTLDAAAILLNGSASSPYTNVTIRDCPSISGYEQAVYIYDSTYITIENSTAENSGEHGFYSSYSNYTTISNSFAYNNPYGVYLEFSEYANLEGTNATENTMYGMYLQSSNNSNVTNVDSSNNTLDGLYLNESYDVTIDPSKFKDNAANGINLNNADGITLQDLTITGNGANGIRATSATNIGLTNLNVSDNQGHGLHMVQSDNIVISQSTFCLNHQYGIRHQQGSGLQVSTTDICDNTEYGVYLVSSTGTILETDEIFGNGETGVFASNSGDMFILYSHFYDNVEDLEVSENAATPSPFNATQVIFDRAAGDYQDFTNLTINDTVTSYAYTISWDGGLPTEPPGYFYFSNKYLNISTTAGAPSIALLTWHWTAGELGSYNEDDFELWEYSAGWSAMNSTPDTGSHSISLYGLTPSSGYGLLQKNVTNLTVYLNVPSDGHLTTSTTITFNCSAASPSPLANITLYGNWSGGWHANETKALSGTYDSAVFTKTLPLGTYEWNCLANDSTANTDWGDSNYTFTIRNATEDLYALGGANVTVLNTSKYNGSDLGGTYELQGGNLTGADFSLRVSTEKWAGMYGNLTAKLILSEGSDTVFMYAWNWTPENGGEVCLTQNTGPFWTALAPTLKTNIDTAFGYNPTDSDSANSTLTDASVLISVANTSSPTTGVHLGANSTFEMGAFQFVSNASGEEDFAFCVNLTDGINYRNNSVHFELVVPTTEEKGLGPLETYYVYVELH